MHRALVFAVLLGCTAAPAPRAAVNVAPPPAKHPIGAKRNFVSNKVPAVHVEWLEITVPSETASTTITATLEQDARESLNQFVKAAHEAKKEEPRDLDGMPSADRWELKTTCRPTTLRASLVSVRCDEYTYTGGAHGMEHAQSITWSIVGDTATALKLDDLFTTPYVDVLDAAIMAELRVQEADWVVDSSLASVVDHLHTWNVTKEGLQFVFDPYEVGSHAQGPHEVMVPWKVLDPLRRRPGPLDAVAP